MFMNAIFNEGKYHRLAGNRRFTMGWLRSRLVSLLRQDYGYFSLIVALFIISIVTAKACNAQASEGKREGELILKMDPPLTFINKSRNVIFRVNVLKGAGDVVDTVRLMQTDAEGNPIAEAGIMNDNGESGDQEAGNGSYATTLTFDEPAPVTRYYQAIVSLKNDSRKILSIIRKFQITEKPYYKEPSEDKMIYGEGAPFPVNRVVIRLVGGEEKATAKALADSVGGSVVGYAPIVNQYSLEVPATTVEELEAIIGKLRADPRVAGAMKSIEVQLE
jgi:hypothetical protein